MSSAAPTRTGPAGEPDGQVAVSAELASAGAHTGAVQDHYVGLRDGRAEHPFGRENGGDVGHRLVRASAARSTTRERLSDVGGPAERHLRRQLSQIEAEPIRPPLALQLHHHQQRREHLPAAPATDVPQPDLDPTRRSVEPTRTSPTALAHEVLTRPAARAREGCRQAALGRPLRTAHLLDQPFLQLIERLCQRLAGDVFTHLHRQRLEARPRRELVEHRCLDGQRQVDHGHAALLTDQERSSTDGRATEPSGGSR
jgi:hypothetical protein